MLTRVKLNSSVMESAPQLVAGLATGKVFELTCIKTDPFPAVLKGIDERTGELQFVPLDRHPTCVVDIRLTDISRMREIDQRQLVRGKRNFQAYAGADFEFYSAAPCR